MLKPNQRSRKEVKETKIINKTKDWLTDVIVLKF